MWPTYLVRTNVRNGFDNPLGTFAEEMNRALTNWRGEAGEQNTTGAYPVDIHEDADNVYVDAELPGFKPSEINVTLENGVLTILAERKTEANPKGEAHLRERRFTRVARSFAVPSTLDEGKVQAQLQEGVLHLTLHKREEVKPRKIEVKVGGAASASAGPSGDSSGGMSGSASSGGGASK